MEQIKVHDNFLKNEDLETCKNIIKDGRWEYGHTSDKSNKMSTPFFYMDLMKVEFFNAYLKEKIETTLGLRVSIDRVYANGQTFGLDGCFHQDSTDPNTITFCLYISPIPNDIIEDIGGNIFFKVPSIDNFTLALEPRHNRGVSFPSMFFHKGVAFNRYIKNMRICVAWKLRVVL
jgi:hypothetical protein